MYNDGNPDELGQARGEDTPRCQFGTQRFGR